MRKALLVLLQNCESRSVCEPHTEELARVSLKINQKYSCTLGGAAKNSGTPENNLLKALK